MTALIRSVRLGLVVIAVGASAVAAQDTTAARATLRAARALADSGAFMRAETLYATVAHDAALPRTVRGSGYFGSAFAVHQRLLADGDAGRGGRLVRAVELAYDSARKLNRDLFVPVTTNMALLNRAFDIHGSAVKYFIELAESSTGSARSQYYTEAAIQADAAGQPAEAARLYETALGTGVRNETTVRAYLRSIADRAPAPEVLRAVSRWGSDARNADAAFDALVVLLTREVDPVDAVQARSALTAIAQSLVTSRVGPGAFQTVEEALLRIGSRRRDLTQGVNALVDAYRLRGAADRYDDSRAVWWKETNPKRAAWSRTLTWIGTWYNQQGQIVTARSFFEAAVGPGGSYVNETWADRGALVPLALIYARADTAGAPNDPAARQFTEIMFSGKGLAYAERDVETIRLFHTVLGTYYATKGKWSGDGFRNAEFQLDRMREATAQMKRQGRNVTDSPELLAKLAVHYEAKGQTSRANEVKSDVRRYFTARGKPAAADSLFRVTPRTLRPPS